MPLPGFFLHPQQISPRLCNFLEDMNQILIPEFSNTFAETVAKAVEGIKTLTDSSTRQYSEAESYLIKEIGIDMSSITNGGVSIKSFSECFFIQNRIDSEFYQPKYDKIIESIKKYDANTKSIDEISNYVFTGECADEYFTYKAGLCHYIRGTDIHEGIVDVDLEHAVEAERHGKFVSTGDIVTGRVGTIGNFGVISEALNGSVCSDNVLCFHLPDNYLPDVYALYFNSPIIKELTKRISRGSVQQRLNQETLRELIVPYIDENIQKEIDSKIKSSFVLKQKSEKLLECAKTAVEMAIEQDGTIAVSWLKSKIDELTK